MNNQIVLVFQTIYCVIVIVVSVIFVTAYIRLKKERGKK